MSESEKWSPLEPRADLVVPIGERLTDVQVDFVSFKQLTLEEKEKIRQTVREFLQEGYRFLHDRAPDLIFAKRLQVEIRAKRKHHAAQGALMYISYEQLHPILEGDLETEAVQQSLIVHELVHQFTDDEGLPMLAEFMYVQDSANTKRIEQLRELYRAGKLIGPYEKGLMQIAEWFGLEVSEEIFDALMKLDSERISAVFQKQIMLEASKA